MYDNGRGVKQDYIKAVEWYQRAAEQGVADAQYNLGVMYQYYIKAVEWYQKAAEHRYARAQSGLGFMYDLDRLSK